MDGVEELAHDGNDGLHRCLLPANQFLVERLDVRLVSRAARGLTTMTSILSAWCRVRARSRW